MQLDIGKTKLANDIANMIQPILDTNGCEVVQVDFQGAKNLKLLVVIGKKDYSSISLDECADISRQISAVLDVEDPIAGEYVLEVSSPGIDRLLIRVRDFYYYMGHLVSIKTKQPIEGRKKYKGVLKKVEDNCVFIMSIENDEELAIPFLEIERARLVLTDDLLNSEKASH